MAAAPRPPAFRGRSSERELVDRLLDNVRGGQSAVLVIRGEAGVGKTALLRYCARQASGFQIEQIAGVESEMELPFAGLHRLCSPMLDRLGALTRAAAARAEGRPRHRVRRGSSLPGRAGRAQPPGRGHRGAAAALLGRRRAVARCRLEPGTRVRRAPAAGGVGGDRVRSAGADRRARAGRPAGAAAARARRRRRARPARDRDPGPARRARPRPDRGRDARQPARAAGAAARALGDAGGRRVRAARVAPAVGANRGELPAAAGGAARRDAPAAPGRGRGTGRRPGADVAGGDPAGGRGDGARSRGADGPAGRAVRRCASGIRLCGRRSTDRPRTPSVRACTTRWRR